ncbi:MAG: M14 family metallopeptidase [Candidatus Jorgensenbacteria bacterium]|nr:M14 family metallopeptidase [Candidatus Jorgensenbacteria bacterium]
MRTKRVIAAIVIAVLGVGLLIFILLRSGSTPKPVTIVPVKTENYAPKRNVIGLSVEGRQIESYTYGSGKTLLAFVGGVHGGYEWNSVLLAYAFMDYLNANPKAIPANLTVAVIPSANPDGVYKVIGKEGRFTAPDVPVGVSEAPGRFNAHKVDLNRNFDCKWKPESMWQGNVVSAGTAPFSEPETRAIRDFVFKNNPAAVVFWHSQSNAVYASECERGILPKTLEIIGAYSHASGYPAVDSFSAYEITGDAEGWLASINIPAITVELKTHETVEWERNLAGIKALFGYYTK